MKRNCNNCKALDVIHKYCTLGFRIQGHKDFEGITLSWKPLEECPKPKTYSKYLCEVRKGKGNKNEY